MALTLVPTCPTPDAIMMPATMKAGRNRFEKTYSVSRIAEPILEVDYAAGERAWIKAQAGDWLFITKNREDTIYMSDRSGAGGRPRYEWIPRGDGIRFGYLTAVAREWAKKCEDEKVAGPAFVY